MLICFLGLLLSISIIGCKSRDVKITKPKKGLVNSCDMVLNKLAFSLEGEESKWLLANKEQCSRINEFLQRFGYSGDSIEYMKTFVKVKLQNNNYKLERFIELYQLLHKNPAGLIDGTLNTKNKEKH